MAMMGFVKLFLIILAGVLIFWRAQILRDEAVSGFSGASTLTTADRFFIEGFVKEEHDKIRDELAHMGALVSKNSQTGDSVVQSVAELMAVTEKQFMDAEKFKERCQVSTDSGTCDSMYKTIADELAFTQQNHEDTLKVMEAHNAKVKLMLQSANRLVESASSCVTKEEMNDVLYSAIDFTDIKPLVEEWVHQTIDSDKSSNSDCMARSDVEMEVKKQLNIKAHDDVGMRDYALDINNASIIEDPRFTSEIYNPSTQGMMFFIQSFDKAVGSRFATKNVGGPREAISASVSKGECFAFAGSHGFVTVALEKPIRVEAITLEHLHRAFGDHQGSSAPRKFRVWGYENYSALEDHKNGKHLLLEDEYKLDHPDPIQTFYGLKTAAMNHLISIVTLEVLSNHDHKSFTCIYRFRVHGKDH